MSRKTKICRPWRGSWQREERAAETSHSSTKLGRQVMFGVVDYTIRLSYLTAHRHETLSSSTLHSLSRRSLVLCIAFRCSSSADSRWLRSSSGENSTYGKACTRGGVYHLVGSAQFVSTAVCDMKYLASHSRRCRGRNCYQLKK